MTFGKSLSTVRALFVPAILCVALTAPSSAKAAFHFWAIQEVYSNSNGTLQFIELVDQFGGQNFVGGQQIQVVNSGGTQTNTFTIPSDPPDFGVLPGDSLNHMLLFGTAGLHAAGGPTPDFILPNNFLFTGGGTINFFGFNGGTYSALPTNGLLSRTWNGGDALNTPTNYLNETGTVTPVPEPSALVLSPFAAGLGTLYHRWRRQRFGTANLPTA